MALQGVICKDREGLRQPKTQTQSHYCLRRNMKTQKGCSTIMKADLQITQMIGASRSALAHRAQAAAIQIDTPSIMEALF